MSAYNPTGLSSSPVVNLNQVVTDVPRITWAQRGYSDLYTLSNRWSVTPEQGVQFMAVTIDADQSIYAMAGSGTVYVLNPAGETERTFSMPGAAGFAPVDRIVIDETGAIYVAAHKAYASKLFRFRRVGEEKAYFELHWEIDFPADDIRDFDVRNGVIAIASQQSGASKLERWRGILDFEPDKTWQVTSADATPLGHPIQRCKLGSQGAIYVGILPAGTPSIQKWSANGDKAWGTDATGSGMASALAITSDDDVITCGPKDGGSAVVCRKLADLGTSFSVSEGTAASLSLTFTGAGSDGDTITIDGPSGLRVYTLKTVLDQAVADQALIGVDATATALNLSNAIKHTLGLATYSDATTINLDVTASPAAGVVTVSALVEGADGNDIDVSAVSTSASWGGAALTGGVDGDGAWTGTDTDDLYGSPSRSVTNIKLDSFSDAFFSVKNTGYATKQIQKRAGAHGGVLFDYAYSTGKSQVTFDVGLQTVEPVYHTRSVTGSDRLIAVSTVGSSQKNTTVHNVTLVSSAHDAGNDVNTRRVVGVAVSGGTIYTVERGGTPTVPSDGTGALSTDALLVQSTVAFGKVYYTDGLNYKVYDPEGYDEAVRRDGVSDWTARGLGQIPERARLISTWSGRVVLARMTDEPHNWAMSAKNDPRGWEFFKPVPLVTDAILGNDSRQGLCPDIINAIIPYSDDLVIFGGDSSMHRLTGDPGLGGYFDLVTDSVGVAYGSPWCKDTMGVLYFFGSRGGIYAMHPGGVPQSITIGTIESELLGIDLSRSFVELAWNTDLEQLHLFVLPRGVPSVATKHWVWERKRGWFPDTFVTTGLQPTSVAVFDGDAPGDRVLVLGGYDGKLRYLDRNATSDDGERIEAEVEIGPISPLGSDRESMFTGFQACLARAYSGCRYEWLIGDEPDNIERVDTGRLSAGLNPWIRGRHRGNYISFRLRSSSTVEGWELETLNLDGSVGAKRRARQR